MRHRMLLLFCALVAVLPLGHALADDKVELSQSSALVGQRLEMHLQVTARHQSRAGQSIVGLTLNCE